MQKVTLIGKGLVSKHLTKCLGERVIAQYDSKSINTLPEKEHEIILCAAPSAKKWIANANPEDDLKSCNVLIDCLRRTKLKRVILFSTIDVYASNVSITGESSINYSSEPYGKNRKTIEDSLLSSMPCSVVRLPALFGEHLEKNYVFDLMNDNNLSNVKTKTSFQWLDLRRISECVVAAEKYDLVNYVVEPVSTLEVVEKFFPDKLEFLDSQSTGLSYNVKSQHTSSGYFHGKDQVIQDMENFFNDRHHNRRSYGS